MHLISKIIFNNSQSVAFGDYLRGLRREARFARQHPPMLATLTTPLQIESKTAASNNPKQPQAALSGLGGRIEVTASNDLGGRIEAAASNGLKVGP